MPISSNFNEFFIKTLTIVVLASFGLAVVMLIRKPLDIAVRQISTQKEGLFRVTDTGKIFVTPDTAMVTLAVIKEGKKIADVQKEFNEANSSVLKAIKNQGIEDKFIKTINYSITPNYRYEPASGRSSIDGYRAEARLEIKIKNFDKLNTVIDTATAAGANEVGTVNFTVDNRDAVVVQARDQAIQKAKAKAGEIARATGLTLGKIIDVQVSEGDINPPPIYGFGGQADMRAMSAPTEISKGENAITVTVTLSYETQ